MTLTIVWHKPCWFASQSPTGFASRGCLGHPGFGGLPREVEVLSELFDSTRIVGPCYATGDPTGEIAITGKNISMIALTWLHRSPWLTWVVLPFWFCRNGLRLIQEISKSDAVYVFIPSPIGLLGLILGLAFRKPILARQLNKWSESRRLWRFERAFLEKITGGKNVVFATGASEEAPSSRNPEICWLFITSITQRELASIRRIRAPSVRLIMIGRVVETLGTLTVLRALPLLSRQFPEVHLDVVGDLPLPSELKHVAQDSNVFGRVTFHGSPGRQRIVELLREADVFCCVPGAETEHYRQALHEALACGLPVVTSSTEIAPMLMRKGCAIVLKEETPTALAEAVMDCLSDSDRYVRMSGEALRTAQEYSLERWRETVRCALENAWGPLRSVQ